MEIKYNFFIHSGNLICLLRFTVYNKAGFEHPGYAWFYIFDEKIIIGTHKWGWLDISAWLHTPSQPDYSNNNHFTVSYYNAYGADGSKAKTETKHIDALELATLECQRVNVGVSWVLSTSADSQILKLMMRNSMSTIGYKPKIHTSSTHSEECDHHSLRCT